MVSGNLQQAVESLIERETGRSARIVQSRTTGGGCINHTEVIELEDGRRYFLKFNPHPLPGMFPREAEGLQAMADAEAIRVPVPVGTGGEKEGTTPFIVMEYIPPGSERPGFQEEMGRRFAELHRKTQTDRFGFPHDNYLGSTPQPNGWKTDWVEFWRENRLGFQLDLARKNGLADPRLSVLGDRLMNRLDDLIGEPEEPACLLHGDLWSGNYMADERGEPVFIDPAAYYGRREADLAMTRLFGGFDRSFYAAYEEVWPLMEGSEVRLDIYKLYHLLNHLNLFGGGYRSGCMEILRRYA